MPVHTAHDPSLDAAPVAWHRREGRAGLLLLCEHASAHIPPGFQGLGLPAAELQRHIAWDIGALALAQALSDRLDAPLAYATIVEWMDRRVGDDPGVPAPQPCP